MPPPPLARGYSKEGQAEVFRHVKEVGKLVKQLSTDGSALKAAIDASPPSKARGSRRWSSIPMAEIAALRGLNGPDIIDASDERYTGLVDFDVQQTNLGKKPMRELAATATAARQAAAAKPSATRTVAANLPPARRAQERPAPSASQPPRPTSHRRRRAAAPAVIAEWLQCGASWIDGVLPLLADALHMISPTGGTIADFKRELIALSPRAAMLLVLDAAFSKAAEGPLKRSPAESAEDVALRAEHQVFTDAPIFPRSHAESKEQFHVRLKMFKPNKRRNTKRNVLVWPQQPGETPHDFEARMAAQAATAFIILPRRAGEATADFQARLDAIQENSPFWSAEAPEATTPLVLPRGMSESEAVYAARLEMACSLPANGVAAPYCLVVLPQGTEEDDEHAHLRLQQQQQLAESVVPYDVSMETDADFSARVENLSHRQSGRESTSASGSSGRLSMQRAASSGGGVDDDAPDATQPVQINFPLRHNM